MKIIKQLFLVVVVIIATTTKLSAQTFTVSPNDTLTAVSVLDDLNSLTALLVHPANDTLYLQWKKVYESIPLNWDASICDYQHCYSSLLDSGLMSPIVPGDDGVISCHITPHINYGTATIRYTVWDINNPALIDTITWIVSANITGVQISTHQQNSIWITKNIIHINNSTNQYSELLLMDLNGKQLYTTTIKAMQSEIQLPNLTTALYILQLKGNQKSYQQKIFLQR